MSTQGGGQTDFKPGWQRHIPAWRWLHTYRSRWFTDDLAAGASLMAYMLPGALGDASLAGMPPEAGVFSCIASGLVFWLLCSSMQTSITVTSAISLLIGSSLGVMAKGDPAHFAALASCTALLTAAIAFIAWLAGAGLIVNFISETVLLGFKAGVAIHLASTQLPKLCGIAGYHGDFWERAADFLRHASQTNPYSLALGGAALLGILLGKRYLPGKPVPLLIIVATMGAGALIDYPAHGISMVGAVPGVLPSPALPQVPWNEVKELLPLAMACFLLGAVETSAIGRMFAEKHGYRFNSSQEFLALSAANLAAGLARGFPVSGGMSQSLVNESGGARTPLSGLLAAGLLLVVHLLCAGLLRHLPQPVLAAVVIAAVTSLIRIGELRHLWRLHRDEFLVALAALVGVLGAGLLRGVLVGAVISLALLLRRASSAHVAFLGRIPGTRRYSDTDRHESNEPIPDALAFRVEAAILYFNCEHVLDTVLQRIDSGSQKPTLVVCDLSNVSDMDIAGAQMLLTLYNELERRGMLLQLVEARSHVRDMLRVEGVEDLVGKVDRFTILADVLDDFHARHQARDQGPAAPPLPPVPGTA